MAFEEVVRLMDQGVNEYAVPCSDLAITYNGEIVFRYMNGTRDDDRKLPLKGDELYFLYSASKPITCSAALLLLEKGKLSLDDHLSDYIPEYKNMWIGSSEGLRKSEKPITIKSLFTMSSGMNYELNSQSICRQIQKNPSSNTQELVRAMAGEPLMFEPGEHFFYSLSHDVLAAVIEIVSDVPYGEYLKKNIFDVCGMERTGFALTDEVKRQMCSQYCYLPEENKAQLVGKENPYVLTPVYESGGAGLISCVDDYIRFVTHMVNGKLLKLDTLNLMRSNQLSAQAHIDFQSCKKGYCYGLGVRTDANGVYAHKGEFGWDGAAGAYVLMDPDHRLGIFYATHIRNHGLYLYDNLHQSIRDAVYKELCQ